MPSWNQTGTLHFHSSTTPGSASWISSRTRASVSPRQSPSSAIRASISSAGAAPSFAFSNSLCSLMVSEQSRCSSNPGGQANRFSSRQHLRRAAPVPFRPYRFRCSLADRVPIPPPHRWSAAAATVRAAAPAARRRRRDDDPRRPLRPCPLRPPGGRPRPLLDRAAVVPTDGRRARDRRRLLHAPGRSGAGRPLGRRAGATGRAFRCALARRARLRPHQRGDGPARPAPGARQGRPRRPPARRPDAGRQRLLAPRRSWRPRGLFGRRPPVRLRHHRRPLPAGGAGALRPAADRRRLRRAGRRLGRPDDVRAGRGDDRPRGGRGDQPRRWRFRLAGCRRLAGQHPARGARDRAAGGPGGGDRAPLRAAPHLLRSCTEAALASAAMDTAATRMLMGIYFYPRGGSAHATRALARELGRNGVEVTLVAGSRSDLGEAALASSFYEGLDLRAVDFTPAIRSADPLHYEGGPWAAPMHGSYEDRPGAVDPVLAKFDDAELEVQVRA